MNNEELEARVRQYKEDPIIKGFANRIEQIIINCPLGVEKVMPQVGAIMDEMKAYSEKEYADIIDCFIEGK